MTHFTPVSSVPVASGVLTDSPYANTSMKWVAKSLSSYGCNSPTLDSFLQSGGAGIIPSLALGDDMYQLLDRTLKTFKNPSLSNKLILSSIVSEVAFDCFEVSASFAKVFQLSELQKITEDTASYAMGVRILGGTILALSSIDEALSLNGFQSVLGSNPSEADKTWDKRVNSVLRTGEVTAAAISNIFLLMGGESNSVYTTASLTSNFFKAARLAWPYFS